MSQSKLLNDMGQEFNRLYSKSETRAIEFYRESLLEHQGDLVPDIIPLKDFASLILELLEYLKGMGSRQTGLTTQQILEGTTILLQMKASEDGAEPPPIHAHVRIPKRQKVSLQSEGA